MFSIELTLKSGKKTTFFISNNFTVIEPSDTDAKEEGYNCAVVDGNHNNGWWRVKETYAEVIKKMNTAMKKSQSNG